MRENAYLAAFRLGLSTGNEYSGVPDAAMRLLVSVSQETHPEYVRGTIWDPPVFTPEAQHLSSLGFDGTRRPPLRPKLLLPTSLFTVP